MNRFVTIRNKTHADIPFGNRNIPAMGTLHIPFVEYSGIIKRIDFSVNPWTIEVSMPDTSFKNVSVKDFGAVGDGISDDTYQVQSAIDYVAGNGGGVVYVPVGIYRVRTISIVGNVMLTGESKTDSIIRLRLSGENSVVTFGNGECGAKNLKLMVV